MKRGEIDALYDKWFMKPVPPKGLSFDFAMSDVIKARYAARTTRARMSAAR